ncbi:hypothetical protein CHU98_g6405 [Xylaria longipes]|nr:hypothetical protein CHU98_g6405 [Xylaria longipes]
MLCDKCSPMFQASSDSRGEHHSDHASFTSSASQGCYICKPLLHSLLQECETPENCLVKPSEYAVLETSLTNFWECIYIEMMVFLHGQDTKICVNFQVLPKTTTVAVDLRQRDRETRFLDATRISHKWMTDCLSKHDECPNNSQPKSYPTRLLELGGSELRLIFPEEEKPSGPYVALSYCWGRDSFLHLTTSNLHHLRAGVTYSALPIAFQEAACLTQNMNFRYLWIDALCIIQSGLGSTEDWRTESARMGDVYSNSIVTVALSHASNPSQSCLGGYSSDFTPPFEIKAPDDSENQTFAVIRSEYLEIGLHSQPLGFRAWALQERLLSSRILSLGMGELFWDCDGLQVASECFPKGLTSDVFIPPQVERIPRAADIPQLELCWERILADYTARDLTYPETDKLVALSAIARQLSVLMQDVYIAGHFLKMLPRSLNWHVRPSFIIWKGRNIVARRMTTAVQENHRGTASKTPSWSWASKDGPVQPERQSDNRVVLAVVMRYTMIPVDHTNPEGQVATATVTIGAFYAEVEWNKRKPVVLSHPNTNEQQSLNISMDTTGVTLADGTRHVIAALVDDTHDEKWEGLVLEEKDIEGQIVYERQYILPIGDN